MEPRDQVTLSGASPPPRNWWGKLRNWALGAAEEEAVKQAGLPAQVAQLPPALGPVADLGHAMLEACNRESLVRELQRHGPDEPLPAVAWAALRSVPEEAREKPARAALQHLAATHPPSREALALLPACRSSASRVKLAEAALREQPLVEALSRAEKGAAGQTLLTDELSRALHAACTDDKARGYVVERTLAGAPDARQVLALVDKFPSDYPTSRLNVLSRAVELLPGQELTRKALECSNESSVRLAVGKAGLKASLTPQTPVQTVVALLVSVPSDYPTTRKKMGEALLAGMKLTPAEALAVLKADGGLAEAVLRASPSPLAGLLAATSEGKIKAYLAESMLEADLQGRSPVEAGRSLLARFPGDYPTTRRKVADLLLGGQPELEFLRRGLAPCNENSTFHPALMAGLEQHLAGSGPAPTALAMLRAVPSDTNSAAVAMASRLLVGLPEATTANAFLGAQGDNRGRRLAAQACLELAVGGATARQQVLAALKAIPSDLSTTRGQAARAAAAHLADAPLQAALSNVSENSAAYPLTVAWLAACERGATPVGSALEALKAIPSDYPTSRAKAADGLLAGLDSPLARMAAAMVSQGVDSTPKWSIYQSALSQLSQGEPDSLARAALTMLRAIPSDYSTSQKNAALACARHLTTVYSDAGPLQGARTYAAVLEALEQLKERKSDRQALQDMARAVTARDQTVAIEQRDGMLVVGGTRVRVRD